jgi:Domain of unknown function (DUF4332)
LEYGYLYWAKRVAEPHGSKGPDVMKIVSFALDGNRGWPDLELSVLDAGLNVFYGPTGSSKTAVADLMSHVLYGRRLAAVDTFDHLVSPEGEVVVESRGRQYRLRRYQDNAAADRLTVAATDGSAVDENSVRQLVSGLSPGLLAPLFVTGFRESPRLEWLLSEEFAREFQTVVGERNAVPDHSQQADLFARRDALSRQLEARLAKERRRSRELDDKWRDLNRRVQEQQREMEALAEQLRAAETELADVDSRLRYRDLHTIAAQQWASEPSDFQPRLTELDEQINRWRQILAELEQRQGSVQARLAAIRPPDGAPVISLADQRAWLGVTRELVADLQGEVSRFARAHESNLCVCHDAHPRLRPIAETLRSQLDALEAITDQQDSAARAANLQEEAERLRRSQAEIRGQLDHILDQRQALARSARPRSLREAATSSQQMDLPVRRAELQHARAALHERLAAAEQTLDELRARQNAVEQKRAAVLSTGTVKKLQRRLARLQRELERAARGHALANFGELGRAEPLGSTTRGPRASDFLAQISDGELVRLQLGPEGDGAHVVNRAGQSVPLEALSSAERDQVYISLCLSLVAACSRHGVRLPLVLDEPFLRLDHRATAALAAMLDDFGRRGHQVLLFTGTREAAARLASLGTVRHHMADLQRRAAEPALAVVHHAERPAAAKTQAEARSGAMAKRKIIRRGAQPRASQPTREPGRRFYLEPLSNVVHSPSIGPKTAQRLANADIHTVADLLAADPVATARELAAKSVTPEVIQSWQRQARLVCLVPQLRQHDAQILVGCGFTRAEQIAEMRPEDLLTRVTAFCATAAGQRILGENARPDLALVTKWIGRAGQRRKLDAA